MSDKTSFMVDEVAATAKKAHVFKVRLGDYAFEELREDMMPAMRTADFESSTTHLKVATPSGVIEAVRDSSLPSYAVRA